MTALFEEYVMKAITMTESIIEADYRDTAKLEFFTANRERLFKVMEQISNHTDWNQVAEEIRQELNRKIEYIKKLDEKLLVSLQAYQEEVKKEVEITHKQKENIKGYNLSDVK